MSAPITRVDIAEIYDALGDTKRAEVYRAIGEDGPDELSAIELNDMLDAIEKILQNVPESKLAKHDENCWQKHAGCLAERLREVL